MDIDITKLENIQLNGIPLKNLKLVELQRELRSRGFTPRGNKLTHIVKLGTFLENEKDSTTTKKTPTLSTTPTITIATPTIATPTLTIAIPTPTITTPTITIATPTISTPTISTPTTIPTPTITKTARIKTLKKSGDDDLKSLQAKVKKTVTKTTAATRKKVVSKKSKVQTTVLTDKESITKLYETIIKDFNFSSNLKRFTTSFPTIDPHNIHEETTKYLILKLVNNEFRDLKSQQLLLLQQQQQEQKQEQQEQQEPQEIIKLIAPPMIRKFLEDMILDTFGYDIFNLMIQNFYKLENTNPSFKIHNEQDKLFDDLISKKKRYEKTISKYKEYYGDIKNQDIWPPEFIEKMYGLTMEVTTSLMEIPSIQIPEEPITIRFKLCCSKSTDFLEFNVKTNSRLGSVMKNVISEFGLSSKITTSSSSSSYSSSSSSFSSSSEGNNYSFKFGNKTVYSTSTPFGLSLNNNDLIIIYLKNIYQDDKLSNTITVTLIDSETLKKIHFSIARHSPLKKLINCFIEKKSTVHPNNINFTFKGKPISPQNTCCDLSINDGDFIDAIIQNEIINL